MGGGNKHYSKDKERSRQAEDKMQKKYRGLQKLKLMEKVSGEKAFAELRDDVDNNYILAKKVLSPRSLSNNTNECRKKLCEDHFPK